MFRFLRACTAAALCCAICASVVAEDSITLDPQRVLSLIHQQATDLLIAQTSLDRAEAEVDLARAWRSGPSIELDGGYRLDATEDQWDRGIASVTSHWLSACLMNSALTRRHLGLC